MLEATDIKDLKEMLFASCIEMAGAMKYVDREALIFFRITPPDTNFEESKVNGREVESDDGFEINDGSAYNLFVYKSDQLGVKEELLCAMYRRINETHFYFTHELTGQLMYLQTVNLSQQGSSVICIN